MPLFVLFLQASLIAQLVKNPPAMQKTWVRSLGWEDPLEKMEWVAIAFSDKLGAQSDISLA